MGYRALSVKFHGGLRVEAPDAFTAAKKLRPVMEEEFHKRFAIILAYAQKKKEEGTEPTLEAIFKVKNAQWQKPLTDTYAHDIFGIHSAMEQMYKNSDSRLSPLAFGYEVYFTASAIDDSFLCFVESDYEQVYRQALISAAVAQDYGYWDNADLPEDVSDEAWEERAQAWKPLMVEPMEEIGLKFSHPSALNTLIAYDARTVLAKLTEDSFSAV